jgi:hypothetical protein
MTVALPVSTDVNVKMEHHFHHLVLIHGWLCDNLSFNLIGNTWGEMNNTNIVWICTKVTTTRLELVLCHQLGLHTVLNDMRMCTCFTGYNCKIFLLFTCIKMLCYDGTKIVQGSVPVINRHVGCSTKLVIKYCMFYCALCVCAVSGWFHWCIFLILYIDSLCSFCVGWGEEMRQLSRHRSHTHCP